MRDVDHEASLEARQAGVDDLLAEEQVAEGDEQDVAREGDRFFRIAEAVHAAAQDKRTAQLLNEASDFSAEERKAIELIYDAFTAEETETGGWLDAERRESMLNQALRVLQPVLALGLVPELAHGKEIYQDLAERVGALREELQKLADAQEQVEHQRGEEQGVEGGDGDGDGDEDGDGEPGDAGEPDEAAPAAAAANLSGTSDDTAQPPKRRWWRRAPRPAAPSSPDAGAAPDDDARADDKRRASAVHLGLDPDADIEPPKGRG